MQPLSLPVRYFSTVSILATSVLTSNLPYNPTRIHISNQPDGKPHAYILQPGSDSTTSAQLSSLDLSDSIDSSNTKPKSLSSALPFVTSDKATAYTSFVDQSGNITVLSGDCSLGAEGASVWRLKPDNGAKNGGTWSKDKVVARDLKGQDSVAGANFLGAAVAFSELVGGNATDTDLYAFGGMCPQTGASDSRWTTDARYSNTMVTYTPQDDTKVEDDYKISLVTSKGPPIAEAGMTMTPLLPKYLNASGVDTQQQDFVVLGGHTQAAFINMSQVALFSLPQAIWSFLPVQQPVGVSSNTDKNFVSPRSGHTAVLSEDGRSIVVHGGWVGDVNTPASPQMAILQIGSGYGGTGAWKWSTVPSPSGAFPGGAGLYGHGAVMLPGNVMMIMGGYSISSATSKFVRRATPTTNSKTFLYNVTSNAWVTSYSAPLEALDAMSDPSAAPGGLSSPSQKAGVGVGVTFGVIALAGAGMLYLWHSKRSKRRRGNRDSMVMTFGNEKPTWDDGWNNHTLTGGRNDSGYDPGSPEREAFPWLPQIGQTEKLEPAKRREVDSTGAFLNIPSPTRGLRRSSGGRNYSYQSTPVEEPQMSGGLTGIHPIVETDEEGYGSNENSRPSTADLKRRLLAAHEIFNRTSDKPSEDPFKDPEPNPLGSHPVSPELGADTASSPFKGQGPVYALNIHKEKPRVSLQDWASLHTHADRSSAGRSSPTKSSSDDRTLSNLSEKSSRSYQSARSMARTTSTRSQALLGALQPSPTEDRTFSFPSSGGDAECLVPRPPPHRSSPHRTNSNGPPPTSSHATDAHHSRKRSATSPTRGALPGHRPQYSFDQLRAESEVLLGPSTDLQSSMTKSRGGGAGAGAGLARPASSLYSSSTGTGNGGTEEDGEDGDITPTSPTRKRLNWVGSIRRALGSYNPITEIARSASAGYGGGGGAAAASRRMPLPAVPADHSRTSSPTRPYKDDHHQQQQKPRRTASDSSTFLALKRGKDDWAAPERSAWAYRDEPDGGDWGAPSTVVEEREGTRKAGGGRSTGSGKKTVGFVGDERKRKRERKAGKGYRRGGEVEDEKEEDDDDDDEASGEHDDDDDDDDWDVEREVEKRDVQVMFTLPKARLRVVNADPDRASLRSTSGGSKAAASPAVGASGVAGREW